MDRIKVARELVRIAQSLVAGVEFNTTDYVFSHSKEPKGNGAWAFALDRAGKKSLKFSPQMSYAEAKKWAKEQPEFKGARVIYVQP